MCLRVHNSCHICIMCHVVKDGVHALWSWSKLLAFLMVGEFAGELSMGFYVSNGCIVRLLLGALTRLACLCQWTWDPGLLGLQLNLVIMSPAWCDSLNTMDRYVRMRDELINQIGGTFSQCICISNHHVLHFKYFTILSVLPQ